MCWCSPAGSGSTSPASAPGPHPPSWGSLLEEQRNQAATADADIGAAGSPVATLVITSREDIEIARQVRAVLASC